MIISTLSRYNRSLIRLTIKTFNAQQSFRNVSLFQFYKNSDKNSVLNRQINNYVVNYHQQRSISLFGGGRKLRKPSIFFIGFAAMSLFVVIEFIYDRYRRSGLTLREFLFNFSNNKTVEISIDDDVNGEKFMTKYASLLDRSEIPDLKPSKIVPGPITLDDMKLTLFQYQNCPFCSKVRTFLDYYGFAYEIIEVNPVMRQQIKFSKNYRKVPILLIADTKDENSRVLQLNDSTFIISALNSYLLSKNPNSKHSGESLITIIRWYLNSQVLSNELETNSSSYDDNSTYAARRSNIELINRYFLMIGDVDEKTYEKIDPLLARDRKWRRWVDDHFVHILSPNIYRTIDESFESFNYFAKVSEWDRIFSKWEIMIITNVGALAMYMIGKRLKRKYRLKDDVRQSLYDSCNYWLKSIGSDRKFMGGHQPSLSDLTVYGVLRSIEGCQAFEDLLKQTKISDWYFSMKSFIDEHHGSNDIRHLFN